VSRRTAESRRAVFDLYAAAGTSATTLETDMTEIDVLTLIATRAADLADRAEAMGLLAVALTLRQTTAEAEAAVLAEAPPVLEWAE
jgi:hypothetical protein